MRFFSVGETFRCGYQNDVGKEEIAAFAAENEIEFVPAFKARDFGFDRSMIGAYGQDDRICAYPALMAEIEAKVREKATAEEE